ncbi:MAG: hypothetical protein KIS81_07095 [Maricaulaceae bacterium]|nr:hypothetical protein [Maricaulaceae bacterium]
MSPEARRIVALAAAVAVLALAAIAAASAGAGWTRLNAAIASAEGRTGSAPEADPARYLAAGDSRAEASAGLQERLGGAARAAGASLARVRIGAEERTDPSRITLEVEAEGDLGELARFIHAVEAAPPALAVTQMRLSAAGESGDRLRLTARIEARRRPEAVR